LAADLDPERGARCFVQGVGGLVPVLHEERRRVFVYVNDPLGVPRELLDATGAVVWWAPRSAWGEPSGEPAEAAPRAPREPPFRLLGQYADDETGLASTRFRYFDAAVARWLSPDPLGFAGGENLFSFEGSPTNAIDPFGLEIVNSWYPGREHIRYDQHTHGL